MFATAFLLLCVTRSHALHYVFKNFDPLCFVEDIGPNSAYLTGSYNRYASSLLDHVHVELQLFSPSGVQLESLTIENGRHSFHFFVVGGEVGIYKLCAVILTKTFEPMDNDPLQISFEVDHTSAMDTLKDEIGKKDLSTRKVVHNKELFVFTDYGGERKSVLRTREFLQTMESTSDQVLVSIKRVNEEALNIEKLELAMRSTSESTYTRTWMLSLATLATICAVVWYQFNSLRKILIHRKIL